MPAEAPLLLLRADASPGIGSGHVSRLLSLAEAWIDAGGRARLLTAGLSSEMSMRAGALGVEIVPLPSPHPAPDDLSALKAAIAAAGPKPWVAVDGYHFDAAYYRRAREAGARVLAVDDVPRLPDYPVDVLLNQNAGAETLSYPLPPEALPLLGPGWALLRRNRSETAPSRTPAPDFRVLVSFGGADPGNATELAIRALKRLKSPYRALVVAGPDNPRLAALTALAEGSPIVVKKSVNMALEMGSSDAALLGGGVTMLESCVAGLPSLIATVAANQEPGASALSRGGAVRLLGRAADLSENAVAAALDELLGDRTGREELSRKGRLAIDGRGAARVAAALLALSEPRLSSDWVRLRPAVPQDALEIWRIANDPSVRAHSFRREPIPLADHLAWFNARLGDEDSRFWVIEAGFVVAGQVRYARSGDEAEVHYSVRGAFRGKGLGTLALEQSRRLACRELGVKRLTGAVISPNEPSERSFVSAGWTRKGEEKRDGAACAVYEASCS